MRRLSELFRRSLDVFAAFSQVFGSIEPIGGLLRCVQLAKLYHQPGENRYRPLEDLVQVNLAIRTKGKVLGEVRDAFVYLLALILSRKVLPTSPSTLGTSMPKSEAVRSPSLGFTPPKKSSSLRNARKL